MKLIILFSLIISTSAFSQSATELIDAVVLSKKSAIATFKSIPYRDKEYIAVKNYFLGLRDYGEQLGTSGKAKRRLNRFLEPKTVSKFCQDIFITKSEWELMKSNCTKNGFFLCSDEVMEFSAYKLQISTALDSDLLSSFNSSATCK